MLIKDCIAAAWIDGGIVGKFFTILTILIMFLAPTVIYLAIEEKRIFSEFIKEHNCVVIDTEKGVINPGYGYGLTAGGNYAIGQVMTISPGRVTYLCDDGIKYTR